MNAEPSPNPLSPSLTLGAVHLTITDLDHTIDFYRVGLGLAVLDQSDGEAVLGVGDQRLVHLVENRKASPIVRTTGLYHFAIRVPGRRELGNVLQNIIERQIPVTGFADHNVSEAIYLPDLDGNGIEIYRDRPRDEWQYDGGTIRMATDPIDLPGVLTARDKTSKFVGMEAGTDMGHMHLHVADLATTQPFYQDVLGFDMVMKLAGSALFMSVDGYHHHLGLNTWQGRGAPSPAADAVGLRHFEVRVPQKDIEGIATRLDSAGLTYQREAGSLIVDDPSTNTIHFST
jgi:catechol 2,3-dioxygenase